MRYSWPVAEIVRMRRLSLHDSDFEVYKKLKVNRFVEFGLSPSVIETCNEWSPKIKSTIASSFCSVSSCSVRLVLPYSRFLSRGVHSLANVVQAKWDVLLANVCSSPSILVSWRNASPPLFVVGRRRKL